jgi:hypothetical protein
MRRIALLAVVLLVLGAPRGGVAQSGGSPGLPPESAVHASVTWLFGDDDALHAPSEVRPASPAASVGDRPGYDGLTTGVASRFSGRENELLLGVSGAAPGFLRGISTRAELALALDLSVLGSRPTAPPVEDRGSALEVSFALGATRRPPQLTLRLLPLNADRLRVGWLELLAWGGEAGRGRDSPYAGARTAPRGAVLVTQAGPLRAELGVKTATFLEPVSGGPAVEEASYGGYAALEVRSGAFAVGMGAGRFEHGRVAGLREPPRAVTTGASVRASVGVGLATPRAPLSLGLEPATAVIDEPTEASGWVIGVEATTLVERLRSFDQPGRSVLEPARAVAVGGTLRTQWLETRVLAALRDPSFVMRSVPGVFDGLSLPAASAAQIDALAIASAGVRVRPWLEPGLSLGVRSPAAVMTASLDSLGQPTGATVVLYEPGDVELLPPGERPVPILESSAFLELRLSQLLTSVAFLGYRRDFNRAALLRMSNGAVARAFTDPGRLFYGLAARAVW